MTSDTPVFAIEELDDQQDGAEDTHNLGIRTLEQLIGANYLDRDLTAPPGSPAEGAAYIVGGSATGAWATHDLELAFYSGGAWVFVTPKPGLEVYLVDEDTRVAWNGSAWISVDGLVTLTDAATITWDTSKGRAARVVLGGNRTLAEPVHKHVGVTYTIQVKQDGTGSRTLTWPGVVLWAGASAPTLTTTANRTDLFGFLWTGTNLVEMFRSMNIG